MVGHGGSSAGSYLADPTSPIPSHCESIVVTSTLRVNLAYVLLGLHKCSRVLNQTGASMKYNFPKSIYLHSFNVVIYLKFVLASVEKSL